MSPFLTYTLRFLACLLVMGSWYYGTWFVAIPLTLWYVFQYPAYEIILIAVLLDIQFYTGDFIPYYFIGSVILVTIFRLLSPFIRSRQLL